MNHQSRKSEAIASFLLMACGAGIIGLSTEVFRGQILAPAGVLGGAVMMAAGFERDRKARLTDGDYMQGIQELIACGESLVSGLVKESKPIAKQIIPVLHLPEAYRPYLEVFAEKLLDENWISEFVRRSKLVCGVTRSGKTTFFLFEIADYYKRFPRGHLIICDINYGKPDEEGYVNNWYGLPRGSIVRATYEEVYDAVQKEWSELDRRREFCRNAKGDTPIKLPRRKILIDELIGVFNEAKRRDKLRDKGDEKQEDLLAGWIGDLLYQGLGYQMEVTFGTQSLAVGENGLNLAMQEQVNVLLLGATATNIKNVSRLPGVKNSEDLIERLKKIRSMPGCQFAAIAKIGNDEPTVKVVPKIDTSLIQLDVQASPLTEADLWWKSVWTEQAERWLEEKAIAYAMGQIKSPLKSEICPYFSVETRSSCPKYQRVKQAWEQAQMKAKEAA